jgi:hypothetical protein
MLNGIGESFAGAKMQECEADHSLSSGSEVKNANSWNFTFIFLTFRVTDFNFPTQIYTVTSDLFQNSI